MNAAIVSVVSATPWQQLPYRKSGHRDGEEGFDPYRTSGCQTFICGVAPSGLRMSVAMAAGE